VTARYDLVVFDWDGTIMDSTTMIAQCIQHSCRDLGIAQPTDEAAKYVIGLGLADTIAHIAPGLHADGQLELAARYRAHYLAREHEAPLYEGVKPLLEELRARGRLLAVATGKARRGLDRVLATTGLRGHFDATRCADEGFAKPHPDMLLHLLDATGVDAARAVMIGDTTHDLELASNAGVDAVAVSYGAHGETLLRSRASQHLASTVPELRLWLSRHT
jgi:phosphoglycolate phosphatase